MLIEEKVEFDGDPAAVWARLSDVDRIPEYWHGTKSLQIISKDGRSVRARAKFAFGGSGEVTITPDDSARTLTTDYTSGAFKGKQVVKVGEKSIEARWDVEFTGLFKLTSGWTGGHFKSGTLHALERLAGKPAQA